MIVPQFPSPELTKLLAASQDIEAFVKVLYNLANAEDGELMAVAEEIGINLHNLIGIVPSDWEISDLIWDRIGPPVLCWDGDFDNPNGNGPVKQEP